jgi:chaperonin GroES
MEFYLRPALDRAGPGSITGFGNKNSCDLNQKTLRRYTMQVRPLHDRVLVKRFVEEEKSKGGIIIPDTAKEKPIQGEIIAVGTGRVAEDGKVRPLEVKKGDKILFGKYSGTEIKIEGDEFLMMREEDILGIIQ